jgi:hypothetical protein
MLGSVFMFALLAAVPKVPPPVIDRERITGRPPLPRLRVGGVVPRPPEFPWNNNRLKTTGQERFPRARVGGLPVPVKRAWANPSPTADLVYGKRVVRKPTPAKAVPAPIYIVSGDFPTQILGLRVNGVLVDVCLVALADAPTSPLRIDKNGTVYAVYLVDTSDTNASAIRIQTPAGVRSIRKTT